MRQQRRIDLLCKWESLINLICLMFMKHKISLIFASMFLTKSCVSFLENLNQSDYQIVNCKDIIKILLLKIFFALKLFCDLHFFTASETNNHLRRYRKQMSLTIFTKFSHEFQEYLLFYLLKRNSWYLKIFFNNFYMIDYFTQLFNEDINLRKKSIFLVSRYRIES